MMDIQQRSARVLMPAYKRFPVAFDHGEGPYLFDTDGKRYLDFLSGIAVTSLGHAHPAMVKTISEQAGRLLHTSNLFEIKPQVECAEKILSHSFPGKCFFANSGAEANEAAIKLARLHGHPDGRYRIVSARQSFHGRSLATVTMTGQEKYHRGFEPLPTGFAYADFNDLDDFISQIDEKTAAVFLEPMQGEGGVIPAEPRFLEGIRRVCDEKNILMILDEVQTGCGRTGAWFAYQHYGIVPDVMTLAKSLGGGVPIGAMVTREPFSELFQPGHHASTFGGNFLSTSTACTFLDVLEKDNLVDHARELGLFLEKQLSALQDDFSFITARRGKGLMQGLVMESHAAETVQQALADGLIINLAGENTLRFLPPLIIQKEHIIEAVNILKGVLGKFLHAGYT